MLSYCWYQQSHHPFTPIKVTRNGSLLLNNGIFLLSRFSCTKSEEENLFWLIKQVSFNHFDCPPQSPDSPSLLQSCQDGKYIVRVLRPSSSVFWWEVLYLWLFVFYIFARGNGFSSFKFYLGAVCTVESVQTRLKKNWTLQSEISPVENVGQSKGRWGQQTILEQGETLCNCNISF